MMTKLCLGFLAVALMMVLIGLNDVRQMRGIQRNAEAIYQNAVLPITHLDRTRAGLLRVRAIVFQHGLAEDATKVHPISIGTGWEDMDYEAPSHTPPSTDRANDAERNKQFATQVRRMSAKMDEEIATLEQAQVRDHERKLVTQLKGAWTRFRESSLLSLALSLAGRKSEAMALEQGQVRQAFKETSEALDQLFDQEVQNAKAAVEAGQASFAAASRMTLLFLAVGVGLAIFLGCIIAEMVSRPLAQAVTVLEAVAAGNFTARLELDTRDEVGRVSTALNQAVDSIRTALQEVNVAAQHVATASQQLSAAAEQLSSGAQEQASSLEETAASLEEITGTVHQTADNAKQANQLAIGSRDTAEKGGRVVSSAVAAMSAINTASQQIADIITVIDEIAFQTNLLALNAAVEAARAGEQGRGFAVVAAEVRNLAQRSAAAAKAIKALIQDSVQKVEDGSTLVNQSGQTLEDIVTSVKRVTDIIAEIAAASQEQSQGIGQVNKAVSQMDQIVQENSAQTEELSSTAQALSSQAQQLQALVGRFTLEARALTTPSPSHAVEQLRAAPAPARKPAYADSPTPQTRGRKIAADQPPLVGVAHGNGASRCADGAFEEF
jgi:methyl-accepting chemotaxis protein